jgi:hypothetical protein
MIDCSVDYRIGQATDELAGMFACNFGSMGLDIEGDMLPLAIAWGNIAGQSEKICSSDSIS